ncbi:methyltransferase domain-containing protein [Pseudochelatococcus sp. B33]
MTSAIEGQIEFEHYQRHCMARDLCIDLDVASGEGYRSALLAQVARSVTGVEIHATAVEHAQANYAADNLMFVKAMRRRFPLRAGQVPSLVSYADDARVVLTAVRYGGGVKGKLVKALRMGTPVVSILPGTEGIGVTNGVDAIAASGAGIRGRTYCRCSKTPAAAPRFRKRRRSSFVGVSPARRPGTFSSALSPVVIMARPDLPSRPMSTQATHF